MAVIDRISVAEDHMAEMWGISAYDYKLNGKQVDLQDLLVKITQQRAASIEQEVQPLQTIINRRNANLQKYGAALQVLTTLQAQYDKEKNESKSQSLDTFTKAGYSQSDFWAIMSVLGYSGSGSSISLTRSECEGYVSRCKSVIDEMNNDAQRDMTRLQAIVDRRDESYSTATSLMTAVSDTRSSVIKNM